MRRLLFSLPVCIVVPLWAALGAGCGKSSVPMAPVSGKVTVDNQPVTSGQVTLIPLDDKNHMDLSAGTIDEQGEYKISTGGSDGAPLGKYKITVSVPMMPTGDNKPPTMPFDRKYADPKGTPLQFEVVSSPATGQYDLKMTK
jgi:hypothetical protein